MEEDVLEMYLGSSDVPFEEKKEEKSKEFKSKGKGEDLWNATNFTKVRPDPAKFNKSGRAFTLVLAETPDEDSKKLILGIAKSLATRNYVLRYQFNGQTDFYKTVTDIEGLTTEAYRPWKKIAPDLANVKRGGANRLAYEMACNYANKFTTFPPAVRCIRANAMYSILGEKLDNPSDFFLLWSECGTETLSKETDYKKLGNIPMYIHIGTDLNIPYFNVKNKDSIKKLSELLKTF